MDVFMKGLTSERRGIKTCKEEQSLLSLNAEKEELQLKRVNSKQQLNPDRM